MFRRVPILLVILFIASCDSEAPPTAPEAYEAISAVANFNGDEDPVFLLFDGDAIGKDVAPNSFTEEDVNEKDARIGLRDELGFFASNPGMTITLHSGEWGDEGWFALKTIPDSWDAAGPTGDGLQNFLGFGKDITSGIPGPGLGSGEEPEEFLDEIPLVIPLRARALTLLVGHRVCGVAYKGDISINYADEDTPLNGQLKGDNLGIVAFRVVEVRPNDDPNSSSSSLPEVDIEILNALERTNQQQEVVPGVCEGALDLFETAFEPTSSSGSSDLNPCEFGGIVIDCNTLNIGVDPGETATVFADPGGGGQTVASILKVPAGDLAVQAEIFMRHLTLEALAPLPIAIPLAQRVEFFVGVTTLAVFKDGKDAELIICQPPDLAIPDGLHQFLKIFEFDGILTKILDTEDDGGACPGSAHGGLRTRVAFTDKTWGTVLPTVPSVSTAAVPAIGFVGTPTVINIQAMLSAMDNQFFGEDEVVVTVSGANSVTLTTEPEGGILDKRNGSYTTQYTPTMAGIDNIEIKIKNVDGGALEEIDASEFVSTVSVPLFGTQPGGGRVCLRFMPPPGSLR